MSDAVAEAVGRAAARLAARMANGLHRVVITGGPRTGKTSLALTVQGMFGGQVYATDDLIQTHQWSEVSEACAQWMRATAGPWIVEGVAAVRALRKFLDHFPQDRPCDLVIWVSETYERTTPGQDALAKGCATIWNGKAGKGGLPGEPGVAQRLLRRGVLIEEN